MSITEKENSLFANWSQKEAYGDFFVKDGAPCPESFENAKYKITFVLKEANDFKEPDMDMRNWVYEYGGCSQTWNNIARWTQAILEGDDYHESVDCSYRKDWLKQISFLNLKKLSGGPQSKPAEIEKFAEEDYENILNQLAIYRPDIIVCCGIDLVADCLANLVFRYEGEWEHDKEQYKFCWFHTQIPGKTGRTAVLSFYHPLNLGTKCTNKELFDKISGVSKKALDGR